jgi:excisionase family DNA binding protein
MKVLEDKMSSQLGSATMKAAAEFLAVSKPYLNRLVNEESIPSLKAGNQRRVAWAWLHESVRQTKGGGMSNEDC